MSWWEAVWQSIVANAIYGIILLVGAFVFGYLRKNHADKAAPVALYSLAACTLLALLIYTTTGHAVFVHKATEVNADNIDEYVKKWTYDAGLSISPGPRSSEFYFGEVVTMKSGIQVAVGRGKDKPAYLQLDSVLGIAPDQQAALGKLTVAEANIVLNEILIELARSKIGFDIPMNLRSTSAPFSMGNITIRHPIYISNEINQDSFTRALDEEEAGLMVARSALVLALDRHPHVEALRHP